MKYVFLLQAVLCSMKADTFKKLPKVHCISIPFVSIVIYAVLVA